MLKTLNTKSVEPKKGVVRVDIGKKKYSNRAQPVDRDKSDGAEVGGAEIDSNKIDNNNIAEEKNHQKTSKSKNCLSLKRRNWAFLHPELLRLAFTKLRQAFVKVLILYYFDLECYIRIEIDISDYAIGEIFSQLTLDNLGQQYLVAFFS